MAEAQLFIAPSKMSSGGNLCVYFRSSRAVSVSYPCFWTFDQREADLYIAAGEKHLQVLDTLWQSRQFDKLDNILQEIENETLRKCRTEETLRNNTVQVAPNLNTIGYTR